jgi:DNA-binding transcriptional LysR family regulator
MADLALLRSFVAIYRHGSLTHAARSLHLSQPAVSQQLKALEVSLGRPLFVRLARGIAATPAGHELAAAVTGPLDALEAGVDALRGARGALAGTVLLGGPADLLAARALPALAPLVEQGLRIRARTGLAQPLLDEAERDELDLVLAAARGKRRHVELEPLFDETFVLVAGPRWAARLDRGALEERGAAALTGVPLVAYADDLPILRRYHREVFGVRAAGPAQVVIDDLRGVLGAVAAGAGISVLPRYLCDEPIRRGELVVLHTPKRPPRNRIYLAAKPSSLRQPRVAAVRSMLLAAARSWEPP